MNSRQRILATICHEEPDRTPIDFGGHRASGIAAKAYAALRRYLNLPQKKIRIYDPVQQLAVIDADVLDRLHGDTIELGRAFDEPLNEHGKSIWADWFADDGVTYQMPRWALPEKEDDRWVLKSRRGNILGAMKHGDVAFQQTYWPFEKNDDLDRLEEAFEECLATAFPCPPGNLDQANLPRARKYIKIFRGSTDRAVLGLFEGSLMETGAYFYRPDRFLMLLAEDPDRVHAFLDRLTEFHLRRLEQFLDLAADAIDVLVFVDDFGSQKGPIISPKMYEEYFKPRHQRLWQFAKEIFYRPVMLHSCGGIRPLLPHFIEAGIDAVNPVQITCKGMDGAELKSSFGEKITFWGGGCDPRFLLPSASIEELRIHIQNQAAIFGSGGGYVFQMPHNLMPNTPPEKIVAAFEAARGVK